MCSNDISDDSARLQTEDFEIIDNEEILAVHDSPKEKEIEEALAKLEGQNVEGLDKKDIVEVISELRHLEERLFLWVSVRKNTISRLREMPNTDSFFSHFYPHHFESHQSTKKLFPNFISTTNSIFV